MAALAEAGALLERPDLLEAARRCANLLLEVHLVDGRLRRVSRDGTIGAPAGVLEDYACVAEGLLALAQVTSDASLLGAAGALLDVVLARFSDGAGGIFDTADDAEVLIRRPQDPTDNATPSGTSAAAGALLTYAALTGSVPHREAALAALGATAALAARHPRYAGWGLAVAAAALDGPAEIAVVGSESARRKLEHAAWMATAPGAVVAAGDPTDPAGGQPWAPLLEGRTVVAGVPAAYVCRGFVCQAPVTTVEGLDAALTR